MLRTGYVITLGLLLYLACLARADDVVTPSTGFSTPKATASYDSLFGADEKKVVASHNNKEAARFALKLAGSVKSLTDDAELSALLDDKIYQYGIKDPEGYAAALAAVKRLAALDPSRVDECKTREQEIYHLQLRRGAADERAAARRQLLDQIVTDADDLEANHDYPKALKRCKEALAFSVEIHSTRGDEINARIRELTAKKTIGDKVDRLAAKLSTTPDPAVSREIFTLLVADLDEPARAVDYAGDPKDKAMIALAARKTSELSETELLDLASWYRGVGEHASAAGKAIVLGHAYGCYNTYLQGHAAQDADRLHVELAQKEVLKTISTLGGSGGTADHVVVWNGHDFSAADRGCKVINLVLLKDDQPVWRKDGIDIPWSAQKSLPLSIRTPPLAFNVVRVEIKDWYYYGGCISEVEVYKGERNLALGCKTKVSGTHHLIPDVHGATLTDGIEEPRSFAECWTPPDRGFAWGEIYLGIPQPPMADVKKP